MEGACGAVCFGVALPVKSLGFGCEGGGTQFAGPAQASWPEAPTGVSSIPFNVCEPLGIVTEAGSPACLLCQTERPLSWRSRPEGARLVGPAGTEGAICDAALP